ncbi:MAG: DoxX family protein, partial [Polyangiaceae bacterium]
SSSAEEEVMTAQAPPYPTHHGIGPIRVHHESGLRFVVPLGRVLFALIFVMASPELLSGASAGYAAHHGVPYASFAVPLAGLFALLGGLSVAFGYHGRAGAWLLFLFLVPVTLFMHAFWKESDPAAVMMQEVQFMKNVALIGAALLLAFFGPGPISVDARWRPLRERAEPTGDKTVD